MPTSITHFQAEIGDVVTACNQRIDSLRSDNASNIRDYVQGCPACTRAATNNNLSSCSHGPACECYKSGWTTGWEHLVREIMAAAEHDPPTCQCPTCQLLRSLRRTSAITPARESYYLGLATTLTLALYNEKDKWDKQAIAALLHMGDPSQDYIFPDEPPDKITDDQVYAAIRLILEKAGI